jgi:hypothetical protein
MSEVVDHRGSADREPRRRIKRLIRLGLAGEHLDLVDLEVLRAAEVEKPPEATRPDGTDIEDGGRLRTGTQNTGSAKITKSLAP